MVPEWTADDAKTISLRLRRGIKNYLSLLGLPRLLNLVNIYTSPSNRNHTVYTKLPDYFFIMQIGKIANVFPKKPFEKCTLRIYSKNFGWLF